MRQALSGEKAETKLAHPRCIDVSKQLLTHEKGLGLLWWVPLVSTHQSVGGRG